MRIPHTVRQFINPARGLIAAAAVTFAVAGMTPSASAQLGEAAGIAEVMQPEYFSRDVIVFGDGLELDETQLVILESLFDDYQSEFEAGKEAMINRFESIKDELQSASREEVLDRVFEPFREWATERRLLGARFIENIRVILTPQQLERWPRFEQKLFRDKHLHKGRFSGESLNMFNIIRDMHLDDKAKVPAEATLDAYSSELHQALKNRENVNQNVQNDLLESLQTQDTQSSLKAIDKQIKARIRVRDVNLSYIEPIAQSLGGETGAQMRHKALEIAFPRIYRKTPYMRILERALELQNIEEGTVVAIQGLITGYGAELDVANEQILAATKQYEPLEERERSEAFAARMDDREYEKTPDPTRQMLRDRKEIGRRYLGQLEGLISEEQFASLPGAYRFLHGSMPGRVDYSPKNNSGPKAPTVKPSRTGSQRPTQSITDK